MELKPKGKVGWDPEGKLPPPQDKKPLESIGAGGDTPWDVVAKGVVGAGNKRRNWTRAGLGATPPRDGPFQDAASGVAYSMPPKTRTSRQGANPWGALSGASKRRG